jgi:hypothetical protein
VAGPKTTGFAFNAANASVSIVSTVSVKAGQSLPMMTSVAGPSWKLLQPGMGVSLRVALAGELIDPMKVSKIVAHYIVYGPGKDSVEKAGGSSVALGLGEPPLWQGGTILKSQSEVRCQ